MNRMLNAFAAGLINAARSFERQLGSLPNRDADDEMLLFVLRAFLAGADAELAPTPHGDGGAA